MLLALSLRRSHSCQSQRDRPEVKAFRSRELHPTQNAVVELRGRSEIDDIDLDVIDPGTLQCIRPVSPSEFRGQARSCPEPDQAVMNSVHNQRVHL